MSNVNDLVTFAKEEFKDKEILDCSGKILYSSKETLKSGRVYLLGYNPGGDPKNHNQDTIKYELDNLHRQTGNSYIDEAWKNNKTAYKAGEHPLQKRVKYLLKSLGENPREVCASNLIFKRSTNQTGVKHTTDANTCWPVHERILQVVKPKMIIAFGTGKTYDYLLKRERKLGNNNKEITCKSGQDDWECKSFKSVSGIVVVGLPHLSRYAIDKHPDVIKWIKQRLP